MGELRRGLVVALSGVAGFAAAGSGWFVLAVIVNRAVERRYPHGENLPSPGHLLTGCVTMLALPVVACLGGWLARAWVAGRLRQRRHAEPSTAADRGRMFAFRDS